MDSGPAVSVLAVLVGHKESVAIAGDALGCRSVCDSCAGLLAEENLRNRVLGGKSLLSIAVKGTRFAVVDTRHVPHMFY